MRRRWGKYDPVRKRRGRGKDVSLARETRQHEACMMYSMHSVTAMYITYQPTGNDNVVIHVLLAYLPAANRSRSSSLHLNYKYKEKVSAMQGLLWHM